MAVNAAIEDRRRKRAKEMESTLSGGAETLRAGIGAIDTTIKAQDDRARKIAAEQAEAKRKVEQDARDAERLGLDKNRDARAAAAEGRDASAFGDEQTAKKADADRRAAAFAEAERQRKRDEAAQAANIAMAGDPETHTGGLSADDLAARAASVGMTPQELLAAADALEKKRMQGDDEVRRKADESAAKVARDSALAKKAGRGPGPPSQDQLDRRLKTQLEIDKLKREADDAKKGKPVEATTVKTVGELDSQIEALTNLVAAKPSINTGTIASARNSGAQMIGQDDPAVTKFRADTANLINDIISQLSGANVPPTEMARIAQGIPQFDDDDTAYTAKLNATLERVQRARRSLVGASKATGRDTSGLEADPEFDSLPDAP